MKRKFNFKRLLIVLGSVLAFIFGPYFVGELAYYATDIFLQWLVGFFIILVLTEIVGVIGGIAYLLYQFICPEVNEI